MNHGTRCANGELAAIIENSDGLIWAVNLEYEFTVYNTAFYCWMEKFGEKTKRGENALFPSFGPAVLKTWKKRYDLAFSGEGFSVEDRYIGPEGEEVVHIFSFRPIKEKDVITGASCMAHDVTIFRDKEESLRRYANVVACSTDLIALIDTNYNYLMVNEAYAKAQGLTVDGIVGKSIEEIIGEELFNETVKPNADRCMSKGTVTYSIWVVLPVSGRIYLDVAYFPYCGGDGVMEGFVMTGRDSTQRKVAEDQLVSLNRELQEKSDRNLRAVRELLGKGITIPGLPIPS